MAADAGRKLVGSSVRRREWAEGKRSGKMTHRGISLMTRSTKEAIHFLLGRYSVSEVLRFPSVKLITFSSLYIFLQGLLFRHALACSVPPRNILRYFT
ncbi:hypothetical protein E2C01_025591 [Portunus trituberculatus]|uniref:Uncharacterized protein n=1 Tax=Portunus trituberculatus TaxID=210409 RepID=A0A5B7EDP6_PORTR|nr:hypothetical protein [Portunus trituberculatus]